MSRRHSLISQQLQDDLERQDRERAARARKGPQSEEAWRNSFARSIEAELKLALQGKSADVIETADGPIVTRRMRDKYPVQYRKAQVTVFGSRLWKSLKSLVGRLKQSVRSGARRVRRTLGMGRTE